MTGRWTRRAGFGRAGAFAVAVWAGGAAAPLATTAGAQPLLHVSRFDEDVEGWEAADADSSVAWSSEQPGTNCDPFSGSTRARHGGPAADSDRDFVPPACVSPVARGAGHHFRAQFRFPPGQDRTGSARLVFFWWTQPNCGGNVAGLDFGASVSTSTAGNWVPASLHSNSPGNAQSASLYVRVRKSEANGELDLEFDEVDFSRGIASFFDGFENGSTCRWSNTVG